MLMLCLAMASAHDVYKWVAPDGSVYFSDHPHAGADRITLPKWPPPQPRRPVLSPSPGSTETPVFYVYNRLTIIKPESGENVRDNQGNVEVTLTVEPNLNTTEDHKIRILLDGQVQGTPSPSLEQSLTGVARGRHRVAAQVINERGRILITSRPVNFYLKQASPLFHPPRQDVPHTGVQQTPRAPMAPRAPRAPHVPFRPAVTPLPSPPPPSPPPPSPPPQGGSM